MKSVFSDSPQGIEFEYLQHIEALMAEINTGMEAVGANAIAAFEHSVSTQIDLCAGLRRLAGHMGIESANRDETEARFEQTDPGGRLMVQRIQLAVRSLQATGLTYAALLKHCGDSACLFTGLCGTYAEHDRGSAASRTERSKWSS